MSVHDHGNCELCDQQEAEIERLTKDLEATAFKYQLQCNRTAELGEQGERLTRELADTRAVLAKERHAILEIEGLKRERNDLLLLIERLTKDRDSWMECANG